MLRTQIPVRSQWHWSHFTVCGRRAIPLPPTILERHIRTGLAYRLTEKRRQSGFKNRRRPEILALHTRWANCCWSRGRSRRPFTGCGRQRIRTIHTRNTGSASCCSPARRALVFISSFYVLFTNFCPHFGQVISILPFPFGTRIF